MLPHHTGSPNYENSRFSIKIFPKSQNFLNFQVVEMLNLHITLASLHTKCKYTKYQCSNHTTLCTGTIIHENFTKVDFLGKKLIENREFS